MDTAKTYYIAGPMSGLPQYNVPLFDRVAQVLRDDGYTVVSPAELDSDEIREEALATEDGAGVVEAQLTGEHSIGGETWGDVLARDVKLISDQVDGIVLLPGWEGSRGARLEAFVGLLSGDDFEFHLWDTFNYNTTMISHTYVKEFVL